jgi:hypothetical protein
VTAPVAPAALGRASTVPRGGVSRNVLFRVGGIVLVLGVAAAFTVASHTSGLSHLARFAAAYSPARLAAGRVWTLPLSALLLGHPKMIGPTSVMFALLFLPYALVRGLGRTIVTGLSGHVVSTLVVAAWVLPASALGSAVATQVVHTPDYGASAFLAACAGGLMVVIARWRRAVGLILLALVVAYFVMHLVEVHQVVANVADVEHLVALATGALVEWRVFVLPSTQRLSSRRPRPARA